jgi:alpha-D-ribose 1-methylphosphonate 5-triphosphate synthase subunit PhnG
MLRSDYTPPVENLPPALIARQAWMALLARAPEDLLEQHLASHCLGNLEWLRPAETGLMMVQGRAGGAGTRFNLGEVSLTRCVLKPDVQLTHCQQVGVAYVMGSSHRHAQLAAVADALLQEPALHDHWDQLLLRPLSQLLSEQKLENNAQAQATKVEFFTVAREAGQDFAEEGQDT